MDNAVCKLATGGDDIKLWDISSSTPLHQFSPHSSGISALAWSQNNQILVSASSGGDKVSLTYVKNATTNIINLAEGEKQTCLALNSTSRYMVTGGKNQVVSIWDIRNKKLKKSYKGHTSAVTSVTMNWNDTYIASGAANGDVLLHNVVSGQSSSLLTTPKVQTIRGLEYSHFKKSLLASVSDDGSLTLWDTNARKALHSFKDSHKASATALSFSPVNDMLLTSVGLDKRIICYDVVGKSAIKTMTVESPLTSIAFMHDGATLAAGSTRGKVYMFDLRMGSAPFTTLNAHKTSVQCVAFQHGTIPKTNGVSSTASSKPLATNQRNQTQKKATALPLSSETIGVSPMNHRDGKLQSDVIKSLSNGDPDRGLPKGISPFRKDNMDTVDIISPLREGLNTPSSTTPVISNSPPELLGRPEVVGKADTKYQDSFDTNPVFSPLASDANDSATRKTPIGSVSLDPSFVTNNKPIAKLVSSDKPSTTSLSFDTTPVRTSPPSLSRLQPTSLGAFPTQDHQPSTNHTRDLVLSPEEPIRLKANDLSTMPSVISPHYTAANGPSVVSPHYTAANGPSAMPSVISPHYTAANGPTPSVSQYYTASSEPTNLAGTFEALPIFTSPTSRHHIGPPARGLLGGSSDSTKPIDLPIHQPGSPVFPHPGAQPSAGGESVSGAAGGEGVPFQAFQVEFMKNLIDDSLDSFRESIHVEIRNLQRDMVRQFQIQLNEMQGLLEKYSVNEGLLRELERLKEENKQLKNKY